MRSAMRAASQLPRRGPTVVDMYLHVNKKSDDVVDDDDDDDDLCLHYLLPYLV